MKICTACKEMKSDAAFSRDIHTRDGLKSRCTPCIREAALETQRKRERDNVRLTHLTCSKCKVERPVSAFSGDRSSSTGYYPRCKGCKYAEDQKRANQLHERSKEVRERFHAEREARNAAWRQRRST